MRGLRRLRGLLYINCHIWLKHHGNRLYGFIGPLSNMSEWMDGWVMDDYPLTVTTFLRWKHGANLVHLKNSIYRDYLNYLKMI